MLAAPKRAAAPVTPTIGELEPIGVPSVHLSAGFWGDRQKLNAEAIIPHAVEWVDRLGWTANLAAARSGQPYTHRGREFADSEIYKLIEAMSWEVARGSTALEPVLDRFITLVEGAQDPDGYVQTLFGRPWQRPRYSDFKWGHELYCFGHLMQAAVAHHRATGSDRLLKVAIRLADHVCVMFGPDGLNQVCGHAEVELGLVELHRITGEQKYLDQAALFIERRGEGTLPLFEFGRAFWQDDMRVRDADVLRGHAVRALYLAAGAVDVAVESGDTELLDALELQWRNTVAKRTYITGGMGSHHMDEAFGEDFVLPPDRSYCETCAGVASIMFSWRLLLATGKVEYADLIERTLYNVVATSPAADGRSFFYANVLHQRVEHVPPPLNEDGVVIRGGASGRQPWFEVSCCPPNVARTLASIGCYIATHSASSLQIHQFASARITVDGWDVEMQTDYPADGRVTILVHSAPDGAGSLEFRVPSWAGTAVLSDRAGQRAVLPGYASAPVRDGDRLTIEFPLEVRVSYPDDRIDAVRDTVAFERGPEVYALESIDLPENGSIDDVRVYADSGRYDGTTVRVRVGQVGRERDRPWPFAAESVHIGAAAAEVPLVRYHEWAERGPSTMRVFLPALH
ncbi:glycoside hydrolase family 127 protein [Leifsonia shinshuensis]|uniref:Glycoside hydrolase family 127 protein n=1 Tax=Leifsonia shinshuensis TaxID=150026 RepID=A0A7G6YGN1_9MICO|nr:glycoside hydrolase family 127 protein [Leifsonia shinshuensis]